MHPVSVRVHHWFVPHRIVWDGWEDFITGGPDGLGSADPYPTITSPASGGFGKRSIHHHLGVPAGVPNLVVSALPIRSWNLIYNEFYRDQDLVAELDHELDPGFCYPVAWEKDYFTSARPWPQKGGDVSLPLGVNAPVVPTGDATPLFDGTGIGQTALGSGTGSNQVIFNQGNATGTASIQWDDPKLIADLTNATAVNVNQVRLAFALQRYQEARARYGSRYTEYLRYLGVRSSDARLQRPEYLGGGKQTISFSEVLKTGAVDDPSEPIGTMKGHGISAMRSRRFRRFFEEHGLVISALSVRPRTMYTEYLPKLWSRRTKEDYWQRELEQIGQQEVYRREVFAEPDNAGTGGDTVFGYQDRYAEYKHIQSSVAGDFVDTLNYWHLGRSFATPPALNNDFVQCQPSPRIFAEQTQDHLWIMASHSIQARRMVSKRASSRIA